LSSPIEPELPNESNESQYLVGGYSTNNCSPKPNDLNDPMDGVNIEPQIIESEISLLNTSNNNTTNQMESNVQDSYSSIQYHSSDPIVQHPLEQIDSDEPMFPISPTQSDTRTPELDNLSGHEVQIIAQKQQIETDKHTDSSSNVPTDNVPIWSPSSSCPQHIFEKQITEQSMYSPELRVFIEPTNSEIRQTEQFKSWKRDEKYTTYYEECDWIDNLKQQMKQKYDEIHWKVNEFGYILPSTWWNTWQQYINQDINEMNNQQFNIQRETIARPAAINCSELLIDSSDHVDVQLKPNLIYKLDYEVVNQKTFECLNKWYGCDVAIPRPIKTSRGIRQHLVVDLYSKYLSVYYFAKNDSMSNEFDSLTPLQLYSYENDSNETLQDMGEVLHQIRCAQQPQLSTCTWRLWIHDQNQIEHKHNETKLNITANVNLNINLRENWRLIKQEEMNKIIVEVTKQ
jgi:hypothetical protein